MLENNHLYICQFPMIHFKLIDVDAWTKNNNVKNKITNSLRYSRFINLLMRKIFIPCFFALRHTLHTHCVIWKLYTFLYETGKRYMRAGLQMIIIIFIFRRQFGCSSNRWQVDCQTFSIKILDFLQSGRWNEYFCILRLPRELWLPIYQETKVKQWYKY